MNILIVLAHPNPSSFNHALARTVRDAAMAEGHAVTLRDLCAEGFDPVMTAGELAREPVLPPGIEAGCREAEAADLIAIVHPNWWSAPPAILRGWCDRCLRSGRAYRFEPDGQGGARPVGLLKARAGLVLNTSNTPQAKEEAIYGDPLQVHWTKVVFGLCGVRQVVRHNFSSVIMSTPEEREAWLAEAADLTRRALALAEAG